jgi:hypothetical protein
MSRRRSRRTLDNFLELLPRELITHLAFFDQFNCYLVVQEALLQGGRYWPLKEIGYSRYAVHALRIPWDRFHRRQAHRRFQRFMEEAHVYLPGPY